MFNKNNNKHHQAVQAAQGNQKGATLYFRIGKNGTERNILEWLRNWKEYKITEFPAEYREVLREMERKKYDMEEELARLVYQAVMPVTKDNWVPTVDEITELSNVTNEITRGYRERVIFASWVERRSVENANIRTLNDSVKIMRDEIIRRGGEKRRDIINNIIGSALSDMTIDSRQRVVNWKRTGVNVQEQSSITAMNLEEAYMKQDWLFVFEAAIATHLQVDVAVDETTVLQRQEMQLEKFKKTKHENGSLEKWIMKYEDQIDVCKALGCTIDDRTKRLYFMENLHQKIFEQTLLMWKSTLTRPSFPQTYESLKAHIIDEYSSQMTDSTRVNIIKNIIVYNPQKPKVESALLGTEKEKDKNTCFICSRKGHQMKKCWYYDPTKSNEENKKIAEEKIKEKKLKKDKEKENNKGVPHKGTIVNLPPRTEHSGMCNVITRDAMLYCEPCNLMGVKQDEIDFVYDSGTVSGVIGAKEKSILCNVEAEDVLLETVTGEISISKEYGDSIFGKTRILKGRRGSVLVSQYSTKNMYQVLNPSEDVFILRGWKNNLQTKNKVWYFIRDEDRYGDKLLHCTVKMEKAKCFAISKEEKFYDPIEPPDVNEDDKSKINQVQRAHCRWNHASENEMVAMLALNIKELEGISKEDVPHWKEKLGNFCSGCLEGTMKEHVKYRSTKLLVSDVPGKETVGDIMFIELRESKKKPLMVHVDVCTKLITGVEMQNKSEEECTKTVLNIKSDYDIFGHKLQNITFDREPGIVPAESSLNASGINLKLKAAAQKVGLAEVSIRLIRMKARATKAGVRAQYGYLPPNLFNLDLCFDSIQVLNRIPKKGEEKSPYEKFTGNVCNYIRDFRAEWGETIIVKKPKGISSDLKVTGQWAVVVRRVMDNSGILKVYIVQTKKYAYRLQFRRAVAPDWVIESLNGIDANATIGFEDEEEIYADTERLTINENMVVDDEWQEEYPTQERNTVVMRAIDTIEEIIDPPLEEHNILVNNDLIVPGEEEAGEDAVLPIEEPEIEEPGVYRTRSGREVRRPIRLIEEAYATLKETYLKYHQEVEVSPENATIEIVGTLKAILYERALKKKPEEAKQALLDEVVKALKIDIWEPVFMTDLTMEQRKLIIPMMKNFMEKYRPDDTFEKFKVRILARGDKQKFTGESEGPVTRVETIMMILAIAIYEGLSIFKVDVGSAFMRTPMSDDVIHQWVRLDKDVVKLLMELEPGKYAAYVLPDGTLIVRMKHLSYGYVEAAHYWNKELSSTFEKNDYKKSKKDKCLFIRREGKNVAYCAITVDDALFAATGDESWIKKQIEMLRKAYTDITVEEGESIGVIGMQVRMDPQSKKVIITQPKWVNQVIEKFEVD